MDETFTPPRYPVVHFLVTYGMRLTWILAAFVILLGVALGIHLGSWWWPAAGVGLGVLLWILLASYIEVLRIIADTLIPH